MESFYDFGGVCSVLAQPSDLLQIGLDDGDAG